MWAIDSEHTLFDMWYMCYDVTDVKYYFVSLSSIFKMYILTSLWLWRYMDTTKFTHMMYLSPSWPRQYRITEHYQDGKSGRESQEKQRSSTCTTKENKRRNKGHENWIVGTPHQIKICTNIQVMDMSSVRGGLEKFQVILGKTERQVRVTQFSKIRKYLESYSNRVWELQIYLRSYEI